MAEAPSDIENLSVTGMLFCEFYPLWDNWQHEQMLGVTYAQYMKTKMLNDEMLHDIGVVDMMECCSVISWLSDINYSLSLPWYLWSKQEFEIGSQVEMVINYAMGHH